MSTPLAPPTQPQEIEVPVEVQSQIVLRNLVSLFATITGTVIVLIALGLLAGWLYALLALGVVVMLFGLLLGFSK